MSTAQIPELNEESRAALEALAGMPETVWNVQARFMPDMMKKVDSMLRAGASPEWIMQRGNCLGWSVEAQTCFLNALHWRQKALRSMSIV